MEQHVAEQSEGLAQIGGEGVEIDAGDVRAGARPHHRAEPFPSGRDLQRVLPVRAFIEHGESELDGARRTQAVGGIAGVHQQVELHDGHIVALRQHHFQSIGERRALERRQIERWWWADLRELAAVGVRVGHRVLRPRQDVQDEHAVRQPLFGCVVDVRRGGAE